MKPPKCRLCNHEHYSYEDHTLNESVAINKVAAINTPAINDAINRIGTDLPGIARPVSSGKGDVIPKSVEGAGGDQTPNRRSREAYNAYMREYMRKRRAA